MDVNSFLQLADALPEALLLIDRNGNILAANRKALNFLNLDAIEVQDHRLAQFLKSDEQELQQAIRLWSRSRTPIPTTIKWKHVPEAEDSKIQCQAFLLKPGESGSSAWLVLRCVIGKSISRQFVELNSELEQQKSLLRKLQASRKALEKEHERVRVTLHSIGDAVITTDAKGCVDYMNPVAEQLTGWETQEARGKDVIEVFNIINEVTRRRAKNPVEHCLAEGRVVGLANHTALIARDGTEYVIEDSAAPIRDAHGIIHGVVLVFRDVTGDRLAQRQLEYLAQHDTLTSLKNRYFFEQQLDQAVKVASRGQQHAALLYIDLDQFKLVNDTAGHAAGDELLVEVAQRLTKRLRHGDILARLGGDEFGIILNDVKQEQLEVITCAFIEGLEGFKYRWDSGSFDVTCSIGIVYIDQNITSPAEAMRRADIACYVSKQAGRNRYHLYTADDEDTLSTLGEMSVITEIKRALENSGFVLHFQPIRDVGNARTEMFEALLRLKHSNDTLIGPGNFIPIAERYGLMPQIDAWVIRNAMKQLANLCKDGNACCLTVNLSGASLGNAELLQEITTFARSNRDVAEHLILEITETAAVTHIDKASLFIKQLRQEGIRFALDDFGTGFSSFSYLKHLPVDFIKIDGVFVRDIVADPVDQAMVRSINNIAHSLGKLTIAEFVEDNEILGLLKEIGVDMVQGYYIGRPDAAFVSDVIC